VLLEPGYARKQLSLLTERAQRPLGLGGVSRIVWRIFMSLMLWMKRDSSRQTTRRARFSFTERIVFE
jgi:hypothetical protein